MQGQFNDRIGAIARTLAPALKPHAFEDLLTDIDAGGLPTALSVLHDIAVLEEADDVRAEIEAVAGAMGVALHP